jgi:hypothetical protein
MRRRWRIVLSWLVSHPLAMLGIAVTLAGIGWGVVLLAGGGLSHDARVAACTRALQQGAEHAMVTGRTDAGRFITAGKADVCRGLSRADMKQIIGTVMYREMQKVFG